MFSKPHIIIGTDFSPCSDRAIRFGEKLRQKTNGHLHVVNVHKYPEEWTWMSNTFISKHYPPTYTESIKKELSLRLFEQVKKCEVKCTQEVLFGDPYTVLNEKTSQTGIDVLILGHQGASAHAWLTGGLVSKMAVSSRVPVFVVKKDSEIKRLAGLLDPAELNETIIQTSEELSFLFSSELELFSIVPDAASEKLGIAPFFPPDRFFLSETEKVELQINIRRSIEDKADTKTSPIIKVLYNDRERLSETLAQDLEAEHVDLAVAIRHKKGKIERFLLGSVTRALLESFSGNLLILPPHKKD